MADEVKPEIKSEEKKPEDIKPEEKPQAPEDKRDYKAEYEATAKELSQAQHTIVQLKKDKKPKEETPKEEDDEGDEVPDVTSVVNESLEKFKIEQSEEIFSDVLSKITDNPDKQKLIKLTYDKKIVKSGFSRTAITEDLAAALAIVDKPRLDTTIREMKQTNIADKTKNKTGSTTGQDAGGDGEGITEEQLTPMDKKIMARHGLTLKDLNKK